MCKEMFIVFDKGINCATNRNKKQMAESIIYLINKHKPHARPARSTDLDIKIKAFETKENPPTQKSIAEMLKTFQITIQHIIKKM
jgi:hypothetical protein